MKRLLFYMKRYKLESIMGPLFKMLEASFELLVPLVVASMIDTGIKNGDAAYVLKMGGVLVLLALIGVSCALTAQYFAAKTAIGVGTALRSDLFAHISHLSYTEIDRLGTAALITRMTNDINTVQNGINMVLRLFLRSPFVVFGAMVMAFTVDIPSALTFAVAIPLLSVVVFGILLASMPLYKKVQKQLDRVLLHTRENLLGVRVIRAFNRQEEEAARFEEENSLLVRLQVFVGKISALMNPVTYVIINAAVVALLWISGNQVEAGIISQGKVVALVNYMSQILVELVKLANLLILISKAMASMDRVDAVFQVESSMTVLPSKEDSHSQSTSTQQESQGGAVEFQNVCLVYQGATEPALENISFCAAPGQTIGVIGGTGSGKTTLANVLCRFYDPTSGRVLLDGRDARTMTEEELRSYFAIVPQKAVLFSGSLRENMQWGNQNASDEEIFDALRTAQAGDFVERKGQGLELHIEQGGRNLSGGQRQRLTIARALLRRPKVLVLDDSASALDFATDARLRHALKENASGSTVFIISQRASAIRHADTILVLDDGALAGCGTHQQLMATCPVYREICLSQQSQEEVC